MIRHSQQIGGVTVNFTVARLDDMPRRASVAPVTVDGRIERIERELAAIRREAA